MIAKQYHTYASTGGTTLSGSFNALAAFLSGLNRQKQRPVNVYAAIDTCSGNLAQMQAEWQRLLVAELGEDRTPAFTLTVQKPLDTAGSLRAEIWSVGDEYTSSVESFSFNGLIHVEIKTGEEAELWTSGFHCNYAPNQPDAVQHAAAGSFESLSALLKERNYTFDHIFRQWNYIGRITDLRTANGKQLQNYQVFNEVRGLYYDNKKDKTQYPAATGIGMDYEGTCISAVAVKNAGGLLPGSPMRSPVQKDAFSYAQEVLVGDKPLPDSAQKKAPLFERGRYAGHTAMVSGTASIRGEETVDKGNAAQQLRNTIGFIAQLVQYQNGMQNAQYARVRLYVKPGCMEPSLREILRDAYPETCMLSIVEADICRPDLLIEIEADLSL